MRSRGSCIRKGAKGSEERVEWLQHLVRQTSHQPSMLRTGFSNQRKDQDGSNRAMQNEKSRVYLRHVRGVVFTAVPFLMRLNLNRIWNSVIVFTPTHSPSLVFLIGKHKASLVHRRPCELFAGSVSCFEDQPLFQRISCVWRDAQDVVRSIDKFCIHIEFQNRSVVNFYLITSEIKAEENR